MGPAKRDWAVEGFSSLLDAARRGDESAKAALYANYRARVESVVRRRLPRSLRPRYDTMDFAQSVFAEVLRDLPRIEDRGERAFVALLRLKAVNKLRRRMKQHLGRGGRRAELHLPTDAAEAVAGDAAAPVEARDDDVKLRRLIAGIDATARDVLRLHAEGRTFEQIAGALGLPSADAARKRHDRALVQLRERWAERPAAR